jgi:hypothetical protein
MVDSLLRKLARTAFRRGMGGDHWAWFVIAGAAYLLNRARQPGDDVATLDLADLEPGQGYEVRLVQPTRRRDRRGRRDRRRSGDPGDPRDPRS